jgi:hypothetical protein
MLSVQTPTTVFVVLLFLSPNRRCLSHLEPLPLVSCESSCLSLILKGREDDESEGNHHTITPGLNDDGDDNFSNGNGDSYNTLFSPHAADTFPHPSSSSSTHHHHHPLLHHLPPPPGINDTPGAVNGEAAASDNNNNNNDGGHGHGGGGCQQQTDEQGRLVDLNDKLYVILAGKVDVRIGATIIGSRVVNVGRDSSSSATNGGSGVAAAERLGRLVEGEAFGESALLSTRGSRPKRRFATTSGENKEQQSCEYFKEFVACENYKNRHKHRILTFVNLSCTPLPSCLFLLSMLIKINIKIRTKHPPLNTAFIVFYRRCRCRIFFAWNLMMLLLLPHFSIDHHHLITGGGSGAVVLMLRRCDMERCLGGPLESLLKRRHLIRTLAAIPILKVNPHS